MEARMSRRNLLKMTSVALSGVGHWPLGRAANADGPVSPGPAVVRQPVIDLQFHDDSGLAQWWLPELLLLGDVDVQISTQVPANWETDDGRWSYHHIVPGGQLAVSVIVKRIEAGWLAELTIENRSDNTWSHVVCPVCLLLHASGEFQDPTWKRTYYRSNDELLTYHGRETDGGRDLFRMSLVKGQSPLQRSDQHRNKWGFTTRLSDDGIIAVVNPDRCTVLTTTWKPTHHLQANRKRTYSCIHANPYFGSLAAGGSSTRRGCVLMHTGSLDHAWNETNRVVTEYL